MSTESKVIELPALKARLDAERTGGRTVAMANGLFDLLHVGHLRYLQAASREADVLVVAVNSDESARRLKGPARPLVPETERAELVAGFRCVDHVVIFADSTVEPLLRELRPNVHCKGTDYTLDSVPEAELARELGIRVAIVGDPKEHATSEMITRFRDLET